MSSNDVRSPPLSPYHCSMNRLVQYVGLTGYGTADAKMPKRSTQEKNSIQQHFMAALEEYQSHQASLAARGLHFSKKSSAQSNMKVGTGGRYTKCVLPSSYPMGIENTTCTTDEGRSILKVEEEQSKEEVENFTESSISSSKVRGVDDDDIEEEELTIFMSFEESIEWKAFLRSIPPRERQTAVVKRTLSVTLWNAHLKGLCLYCWVPTAMCVCSTLRRYADQLRPQICGTSEGEMNMNLSSTVFDHPYSSFAQADNSMNECDKQCNSSCTSPSFSSSLPPPLFRVSMLLHVEEVLRGTNTGHLAAFVLGAPLQVWGVPHDDVYFQELAPTVTMVPQKVEMPVKPNGKAYSFRSREHIGTERETKKSSSPSSVPAPAISEFHECGTQRTTIHWHSVCLYPSSNAKTLSSFLQEKSPSSSSPAAYLRALEKDEKNPKKFTKDEPYPVSFEVLDECSVNDLEVKMNEIPTPLSMRVPISSTPPRHSDLNVAAVEELPCSSDMFPRNEHRIHFILLDSTWGQALSLNRHIPPRIPRVKLVIDPHYRALFSALRKRTRLSGVSTLEAASFACEQSLQLLRFPKKATKVSSLLREVMMFYVNAKCILKSMEAPFKLTSVEYQSVGLEPQSSLNRTAENPVENADVLNSRLSAAEKVEAREPVS